MYYAGNGCYYRNGEKMEYWYDSRDQHAGHKPSGYFVCDAHASSHNSHVEKGIREILEHWALDREAE